MKITRILCAILLASLACMSLAQRGGGQGRGGRGGGVFGLLRRADVQADIQLTDEQKAKLDELRQQMRGNRGNRGQGGTPPTPEEQAAQRAQREAMNKQVEAILTPEQLHRVKEINIQISGERAVLDPEVQTALGLTEEQKTKLKEVNDTYSAAMRSVFEKMRSQELDRTTAQADMKKNNDELGTKLHEILTPANFDKLKELGGKPFVSTEPAGGFGRGGRGGGGGGGL